MWLPPPRASARTAGRLVACVSDRVGVFRLLTLGVATGGASLFIGA